MCGLVGGGPCSPYFVELEPQKKSQLQQHYQLCVTSVLVVALPCTVNTKLGSLMEAGVFCIGSLLNHCVISVMLVLVIPKKKSY